MNTLPVGYSSVSHKIEKHFTCPPAIFIIVVTFRVLSVHQHHCLVSHLFLKGVHFQFHHDPTKSHQRAGTTPE